MPKFFFNFRVGNEIARDPEGTDAPSLEAARELAIGSAREMLADDIKWPSPKPMDAVIVTDESGRVEVGGADQCDQNQNRVFVFKGEGKVRRDLELPDVDAVHQEAARSLLEIGWDAVRENVHVD